MASATHYDILGVGHTASSEQIREAYLVRSKMFHPDRFDQTRQPKEWALANNLLKDLNQAYDTLKSPHSRSAYDASLRGAGAPPKAEQPPPSNTRSESQPRPGSRQSTRNPGPLCSGFSKFSDLPRSVQERLSRRISQQNPQQFMTSIRGVVWNYLFLVLFTCWFGLIFFVARDQKWTSEGTGWVWILSAVSAFFVGTNLSWIIRWHKSPLGCHFIVSPLYFIKTHLDEVWFWPLWKLQDLSATHNYRNGMYTGTDVRFVFDTGAETMSFSQRNAYEQAVTAARVFDAKLRAAKEQDQYDYLIDEDDFHSWESDSGSKPRKLPSSQTLIFVLVSLAIAALLTSLAASINSTSFPYKPPSRFASLEPIAYGASSPAITPLPINTPAPAFTEPELPLPKSGEVRRYTTDKGVAPLSIKSAADANYLVKLDDAYTGRQVLSVFIRGGQTEEIKVPLGRYIVKYASGDRWYGYRHLFGPDTQYSKADREFPFSFDGDSYVGYTLTLYKVRDGNLSTSPIKPDDF